VVEGELVDLHAFTPPKEGEFLAVQPQGALLPSLRAIETAQQRAGD
jgi:hypothetical protein